MTLSLVSRAAEPPVRSKPSPGRSVWTGRTSSRQTIQLQHRLRAAVLARLSAGPGHARGAARADREGWRTPRRSRPSSPGSRSQRQDVLAQARAEAATLIENAHAAAARVRAQETQKAHRRLPSRSSPRRAEVAAQDRARMLADLSAEVGRLVVQTTATVTGKILTPDDHRRLAEETTRQPARAEAGAMAATRRLRRTARQFFRLCVVGGSLDDDRGPAGRRARHPVPTPRRARP